MLASRRNHLPTRSVRVHECTGWSGASACHGGLDLVVVLESREEEEGAGGVGNNKLRRRCNFACVLIVSIAEENVSCGI